MTPAELILSVLFILLFGFVIMILTNLRDDIKTNREIISSIEQEISFIKRHMNVNDELYEEQEIYGGDTLG